MSKKTLLGLAIVLAVLMAALWGAGRRSAAPAGAEEAAAGTLLTDVEMNSVRAITITDGTATTRLVRTEGIWIVEGLDGYPADFDRLQRLIREIDEARNPQVADPGADKLAEFGLTGDSDPAPRQLVLEHAGGTTILHLGRLREPQRSENQMWGPPPGRYVRVDEGPVLLIKEDLGLVQADSGQWWDRRLLELEPDAIRKMKIERADGSYGVERTGEGTFALAVDSGEGEVDAAAANRLFGSLRNLRADRQLASGEEEADAFADVLVCRAETDAAAYRLEIGAVDTNNAASRFVKIDVTPVPEATPEQEALAAQAARKFNGRIFLIPTYQVESMTLQRAAVIRPPDPESGPESESKVESEPDSESDPEPDSDTGSEPESEPAIEPPPIPEAAQEPN